MSRRSPFVVSGDRLLIAANAVVAPVPPYAIAIVLAFHTPVVTVPRVVTPEKSMAWEWSAPRKAVLYSYRIRTAC